MASNSKKKITAIDYTSRDFDSIKTSLVNYTKRYYSDSFKDFNEASFGALVLDSVSYIGDILSFYLDYQVNESFLDTAIEYDNVVRIARQLGWKYTDASTSTGTVQIYVTIPADSSGAPDSSYYPTLRAGSQFTSIDGKLFSLTEDVYFGADGNEVIILVVDSTTNVPTHFAVKATGTVISGRIQRETSAIGTFQKFLQVSLASPNVSEIISVFDSEGHEYFEVSHLAQELIYKALRNNNADKSSVPSILKAIPATRRFVLEKTPNSALLQFGYGSDNELTNESVLDPSKITLQLHGRDYTSATEFDPTNLTSTDKFGVAPSNTTLTIQYRVNDPGDVNVASKSLTGVTTPIIEFENQGSLDFVKRGAVATSLEVNNDEPILGDVSLPSAEELKQRVFSYYATQNRAVTIEDYQAIVYAMPPSFGAVKRCSIQRDFDSFKRNLNLYVISENSEGFLTTTNSTIKENLKTWLGQYKIINDTIDILDAYVVNFGIEFIIVADYAENKYAALSGANARLRNFFANSRYDIGESLFITDIYKQLQKAPHVIDVIDVKIVPKVGGIYSQANFSFENHLSNDGRYITANRTSIFEIKYPNNDVQGSIV
tara:strand:- start:2842 stop:4647 length:1806 start_codon:yes stop_codon:yes gene_type:complete